MIIVVVVKLQFFCYCRCRCCWVECYVYFVVVILLLFLLCLSVVHCGNKRKFNTQINSIIYSTTKTITACSLRTPHPLFGLIVTQSIRSYRNFPVLMTEDPELHSCTDITCSVHYSTGGGMILVCYRYMFRPLQHWGKE